MDLLELLGDEIVVTRPGTDFMTAYRKRRDSPTLKLTRRAGFRTPHPPAVSEFRAAAFHAAVSKARELESAGASRRQSRYVLVSRRSLHAPPSTSNPLVPDVRGTPGRNHVAGSP